MNIENLILEIAPLKEHIISLAKNPVFWVVMGAEYRLGTTNKLYSNGLIELILRSIGHGLKKTLLRKSGYEMKKKRGLRGND